MINNSSKVGKKNKTILILSFIISLIILSNFVNAATFSVGATICAPYWYCTAYSSGSCGSRTCLDANSCGTNIDKPSEFLSCPESGGGGGGGSSGGSGYYEISLPDGYFTLNYDNIKISVNQDQVTQKIIIVNSSSSEDYTLEILYPSSYTKGTEFLTTTSNTKTIDGIGDFNIIIDTRDIVMGTYVIPIKISNGKVSKQISITIDVLPEKNAISNVYLDSKLKTLGVDKEFEIYVETKGNDISPGDKIIYSIIDPKGNTIQVSESDIDDPKNIKDIIKMPLEISEGYYTLNARVQTESGEYIKSTQFTILEPQKYLPVMQEPKNINTAWIITGILVFISIALILRNTILSKSIQARRFRSELKWRKENMRTKIIDLKVKDKIKKMASIFIRKNKSDVTNKAELLKQSYEKGYISLKEYNHALDSEGYHVGQYSDNKIKPVEKQLKDEEIMKQEIEAERKRELEAKKKEESDLREELNKEKERLKTEEKERKEEKKIELKEEKELEKEFKKLEDKRDSKEEKKLLKYETEKKSILDKTTTEHAFVTNDGIKLHSVRDLELAISGMSDSTFNHHTAHGRNDFANWVSDVFRYVDVAEEIRNAKNKEELIKVLKGYE